MTTDWLDESDESLFKEWEGWAAKNSVKEAIHMLEYVCDRFEYCTGVESVFWSKVYNMIEEEIIRREGAK